MTYQVRCDDRIQRLRLEDHPRRHGVDKHLINYNMGKVFRYLSCNLVPQHHAVALSIALRDNSQQLPRPPLRCLKSKPHYPFDAVAREDGDLRRCLPGLTTMGTPALASVLALAVLAHDDPVEVTGPAVSEG